MTLPRLAHLASVALVALSLACRDRPDPDPRDRPVVELVPKQEGARRLTITAGELRAATARLRLLRAESLDAKPLPEELAPHVLDSMIETRLLAQAAARLGVAASTTAVAREWKSIEASYGPEELRRQLSSTYQTPEDLERLVAARLTAQALLEREVFGRLVITDAELREAYEGLSEAERAEPERVHAAQIVLATEEEATRVRRAIERGADFATLARTLSIAPEAERAGDLGWFSAQQMPEVFDQACLPLEAGALSPVTPSPFGYHICKVLERAPARPKTFEDMKEDLRESLLVDKRREAKKRYLDALRAEYDVVRHADGTPPED